MEIILNSKKIAAIAIVFVLLLAGIAYLAWPKSSSTSYSGASVESSLDTMAWRQILKEANGQKVCLSFYRSTQNDQFFNQVLIPLAAEEGVTVTYGDDLGYIGAMNDAKSGGDPKYDMYWMGVSGYDAFKSIWWNSDWKSVLPNTIFLSDKTDSQVSYSISGNASEYVGNEVEFSGGHLVFIYNTACESTSLAYNEMQIGKGATTKTITLTNGSNSMTYTWADITNGATYAIDDVMHLLNSDSTLSVVYGLPNNYTELYHWIQIYPGQFTYCDTRGGHNSYYIGYSFMYGAGYELAWDATKTTWTACTDSSAYYYKEYTAGVNTADPSAVKNAYSEWLDRQTEAVGDNSTALHAILGYMYIYLDQLDDYVYKVDGKSWYAEQTSQVYNKLVGYNTNNTRINDKTVLLSFQVAVSDVPKADSLSIDEGLYAMETGVMEQYCWTINNHSDSKAGCLVVANLLIDPYVQAMWYKITGLIPNIDLDKYTAYLGGTSSSYYAAQYEQYYGFIKTWLANPDVADLFVTPGKLAQTQVDANLSKYYITLGKLWATDLNYT
jgi:ABC-type uncharacterized transport system YnjBCD substrate-binding protein